MTASGATGVNDAGGRDPRVLVVDDEPAIRAVLVRTLRRSGIHCQEATSAEDATERLGQESFDLILADVQMPGRSGLDLLEEVGVDSPNTGVLMVSGVDDPEVAAGSARRGALGYIVKPFRQSDIVIGVKNALVRRDLELENRAYRERLEDLVRDRTKELWDSILELQHTQEKLRAQEQETIHRLAAAAEFHDDDTAGHVKRVSRYARLLARRVGYDREEADLLALAAALHDLGKIGIPDAILRKRRAFTPDERAAMHRHTLIGYEILAGSDSAVLSLAARIALTHHERFDGTGYPSAVEGDSIPLEGRITAVADVFDALTTDRIYRRKFPIPDALSMMQRERGNHFDPQVWDAFTDALPEVIDICNGNTDV